MLLREQQIVSEIVLTVGCYGPNCVHLAPQTKFIYRRPNVQSDSIWRQHLWDIIKFRQDHEGGVLVMGSVPL